MLLTRIALVFELWLLATMTVALDLSVPARVQASLLLLIGVYMGIIDIHVQRLIANQSGHLVQWRHQYADQLGHHACLHRFEQ